MSGLSLEEGWKNSSVDMSDLGALVSERGTDWFRETRLQCDQPRGDNRTPDSSGSGQFMAEILLFFHVCSWVPTVATAEIAEIKGALH